MISVVWRRGNLAKRFTYLILITEGTVACGRINYDAVDQQTSVVDADPLVAIDATAVDATIVDASPDAFTCANLVQEVDDNEGLATDIGALVAPYMSPTLAICPENDVDFLRASTGPGNLSIIATPNGLVDDLRVRIFDGGMTLLATSSAQGLDQVTGTSVLGGEVFFVVDSPTATLAEYNLNVVLAAGS